MKINILTSMPEILDASAHGVLGHAIKDKRIEMNIVPLRDFSSRIDKRIDDRPYGGGAGMIIEAEVINKALDSTDCEHVIELSPQGKRLDQTYLKELAQKKNITLICGRYEGIDHRVRKRIHTQVSIGDYVLSGGEIPALVLIDALARIQPEVITAESVHTDSFENGLLKHPQYTRPPEWMGQEVPEVLMKGNHKHIEDERLCKSLGFTWLNRPDLLIGRKFCKRELALLVKFVQNHNRRGDNHE